MSKKQQTLIGKNRFKKLTSLEKICYITALQKSNLHGDKLEIFLGHILKNDSDPIVRHEAAFALGNLQQQGRISGNNSLKTLTSAIRDDKSIVVRHEALEALQTYPFIKVHKLLEQYSTHLNSDLKATARISLAKSKSLIV